MFEMWKKMVLKIINILNNIKYESYADLSR